MRTAYSINPASPNGSRFFARLNAIHLSSPLLFWRKGTALAVPITGPREAYSALPKAGAKPEGRSDYLPFTGSAYFPVFVQRSHQSSTVSYQSWLFCGFSTQCPSSGK